MIQSGHFIKEVELVEICEKVLASEISSIASERGGPSLLFEAWKGFMASDHSRTKIIELLQAKIVREFSKLTPEEMCEFVRSLRFIEDETASISG
tara:strand:+ start:468 stop:752 length:285 start_codon:yes stop_codon:yes gene_type:complete